MHNPHTAFSAGQHVIVRDERWAVLAIDAFESTHLLKLRGVDKSNRDVLQAVLTPFDRVRATSSSSRVRQRSRQAVLATAAQAIAEAVRWDQTWTAATARIDLHAWQLEPAVAAVSGAMRLLLADAVGLGKTIQAGLVLNELFTRGLADRALVLTPASIREQWAGELTSRFRLQPVVFDQGALALTASALPPDVNPWNTAAIIISSIDLVKRPEVRASVDTAPFDVLIVDEAHHLTAGTDRAALVCDLAMRIPWVVLITATPHSGDEQAYDFLTTIGRLDAHDRLRVFRRGRPTRGGDMSRRSRMLHVRSTPAERELLDGTRHYARALSKRHDRPGARLVGSIIARRAASSARAVARTLSRRLSLLATHAPDHRQALLPWEDAEAFDDNVSDAVLRVSGLDDAAHEINWLRQLLACAETASEASSKMYVIRRLLRRTREQLIVFSEYRDVVTELAAGLADLTSVAALHGGLSRRERSAALQAFNAGTIRTLVATDAAGEGLNLHARCRLVVNLELPWTPLRLEQRIGRVDRMGQTRRVHAIHLVHRDSYEATVVARLERRRALAAVPHDATVEPGELPPAAMSRFSSRAIRAASDDGAVYTSRARNASSIFLLFAIPFVDATGRAVQRELVALRISGMRGRRLTRHDVRTLCSDPRPSQVIEQHVFESLRSARQLASNAGGRIGRRLQSVLGRLDEQSRSAAWQGSLFDRRHEQQAQRYADKVTALREHLLRRRDAALALHEVHAGDPRLVAAWLSVR